jgi:hypothetical protein
MQIESFGKNIEEKYSGILTDPFLMFLEEHILFLIKNILMEFLDAQLIMKHFGMIQLFVL